MVRDIELAADDARRFDDRPVLLLVRAAVGIAGIVRSPTGEGERDIRVAVVVNRVAAIVETGADLSVERSDAGTLVVGDQVRFSIAEPANNRGGGRGTHAALQLDATAICRAASRRV